MNTQPIKSFAAWLKAILIFIAIGLGGVPLVAEAAKPTYPVIFVHGLLSNNTTWDGLKAYLVNDRGWNYGGNLQFDYSSGISLISCPAGDTCVPDGGDFFTINFTSNNQLYLTQQGYELQAAITRVLVHNLGKSKVTLVGHSMGGLAARAYLQGVAAMFPWTPSISYRGDVAKLITIGTPHQGSEASVVLQNTAILSSAAKPIAFKELDPIESTGLPKLNNLTANPLPSNVSYRSIIGFGGNDRVIAGNGDGIVNDFSQNLANLGGFQASLDHRAYFHVINWCWDSFKYASYNVAASFSSALATGLLGIRIWGEQPIVEVHTCEPGDSNAWETIISEILPGTTETVSTPTLSILPAPIQYSPANNVSFDISAINVPLSWGGVSGATSYRVMVAKNAADLPTDPNVATCPNCTLNDTTAITSYTIPAAYLQGGQVYYWRVKARNSTQVGAWSTPKNFIAVVPPPTYLAAPSLSAPVNAVTGQDAALTLSWFPVNNATSYRVMVADSPAKLTTDPTNPICSACVINDIIASPSYTPPAGILKPGKTYYWQAKARSPTGFGLWSEQWSFATADPVTDVLSPQDGVVIAIAGSGQVALYWSGYSDAGGLANYKVVYSTTGTPADCNTGTALPSSGLSGSITHSGLTNGTAYYYRVCAIDIAGNQSAGAVGNATPQAVVATGSLRIRISPAGAPEMAGAQWRLSTETAWRNSNDTIAGLSEGTHTVQFKPITGWSTPADQSVMVSSGTLNWYDGNAYILTSGGVASPTSLKVFPNSDGSLSFTWNDNSNNEDSFNLYASTAGATGPFTPLIAGMLANTVSFTVEAQAFTPGHNYCFRLMAYQNATALFSYSNIVCGTPNVSTSLATPVIVASGENFQIAQKSDGTIWSWGAGSFQQTGYAATGDRAYPGTTLISDVTKISSGRLHSLAIKSDGRVFAWGRNFNGEIGDGTTLNSLPKQVAGLPAIAAVAAGYSHSVAAGNDGSVWAWGSNTYGELGGTGADRLIPAQVAGISDVREVSAGEGYTVAIKSDGTVWAWGRNNGGMAGVSGGLNQYSPQRIEARNSYGHPTPLADVVKVAAGMNHILALKADGTVWAWGLGAYPGFNFDDGIRAQASGLTDVVAIAAGVNHSLALKSDGTVWAWGMNDAGQLGVTGVTSSATPAQVPGLSNVVSISAAANYNAAVKSDGTVVTWGSGSLDVLGSGVASSTSPLAVLDSTGAGMFQLFTTPRPFVGVFPKVLSFPATNTDASSATQTVTVVNMGGATADLSLIDVSPEFIHSTTCGTTLAAGASCSIYVSFAPSTGGAKTGTLSFSHSGAASFGMVLLSGTGVVANHIISAAPTVAGRGTLVGGGTVAHGSYVTVVAIANTGFTFDGWSENGVVVSTNPTYSFQALGDRSLSASFLPSAGMAGSIVTLSDTNISFESQLIGIPSSRRTVLLYNAGLAPLSISAVGMIGSAAFVNQVGGENCGTGTTLQVGSSCTLSVAFTPSAVGFYSASLSVVSDATGSPHVLPLSGVGQLPVVAPHVAVGGHSTGLRSDGTLWAWGPNGAGQLGDDTTVSRTAPVQIGNETSWSAISVGGYHTVALKSDGTLWAWGANNRGQFGDGTTTGSSIPLQVGAASNWKAVAAGLGFTLAIKADGTLWGWGENLSGQLGIGMTTGSLSPVQVGTATNWAAVAAASMHSVAVRSDGTLWAWGYNGVGQLGDGTTTDRLNPVQIGTATTWSAVGAGNNRTVALRSNGSLWSWGANGAGQLGDGTRSVRYSPTQIGTATNWSAISVGSDHTVALRSDGTLWAWGANGYGQLGDGTVNLRLSPSQVGTDTNWVEAATSNFHTVALKSNGELWSWGGNFEGQLGNGSTANQLVPGRVVDSAATGYLNLGSAQSAGYMLDVSAMGGGVVTSSPAGISCGTTCSASFTTGTVVTLTASPNGSSTFAGWSGGCSGTGACSVTMSAANSVAASFIAADTVPDAFSFTPQVNLAPNSAVTSNPITVTGITTPSPININGGEYSINGGAFTAAAGTVANGQTVTVRVMTSSAYSSTTSATLTVGAFSANFDVTTLDDTVPDAFSFAPKINAAPNSVVTSNAITVTGITAPSPISVSGGQYSINGGAYTSAAGTVNNGDAVTVQLTSAASGSIQAMLTIGGVSGAFNVKTRPVGSDFNLDGKADVLWRNGATGETAVWLMNGAAAPTATVLGTVPTAWQIAAVNDLDGDGKADILWRNGTTGENAALLMNGAAIATGALLNTVPTAWQIAAINDLDGDGKADVLWHNGATGQTAVWLMNGVAAPTAALLSTVPTAWQVAAVNDLDGDGKADVLWRNGTTGETNVWLMNGAAAPTTTLLGTVPTAWQIAAVNDLDGDGKADVLWRNGTTGETAALLMNGAAIATGALLKTISTAWQIAAVNDLDGNGKADVLWHNGTTGENAVWLMNGVAAPTAALLSTVPVAWQVAVVKDFNLDGKADVLWRDGTTGETTVWLMNGAAAPTAALLNTVPVAWGVVNR